MLSAVPDPYRNPDGSRKHDVRRSHHAVGTEDFLCVDGEGETDPRTNAHRYVLLGIGSDQIENPSGLTWTEILPFLYDRYRPRVAYTGFYLGYDFTQWLRTFPENRARALLTIDGKEARRSKSPKLKGKFLPVDIDDWQVDMLGSKRFSFRRKECDCLTVKCDHPKGPWMHVCDAGPFFQTSFLNAIDPANWQKPIVTPREFEIISEGKKNRAAAQLGPEMRYYNRLENEVLRRVMHDLNDGFRKLDVNLTAQQWYGPGQAAQSWLRGRAPSRKEVTERVPEWFAEAARKSYFGGWFELMAHGHVPGVSYESDINNAYPYIISQLPCLLHGTYSSGVGKPPPETDRSITLVRALVWSRSPDSDPSRKIHIGAMLHRDGQGRISRPCVTEGWAWRHELEAARRAGCVTRITGDRWREWVRYEPCDCPPPLRQVRNLYQMRLDVGKKSSLGKSAKLVNNSCYGKMAQSVGFPMFANPVYASLITAGCRTMILDAIATHPKGTTDVLMVATDAVFFRTPHPVLTYGTGLGEWEEKQRHNLTLFKPGVYWDDSARAALAAGDHPNFKARGVNAQDFASKIAEIDRMFSEWGSVPPAVSDPSFMGEEAASMGLPVWPRVKFRTSFAMVSALQALIRNRWDLAGTLESDAGGLGKELVQDSNPEDKRGDVYRDGDIVRSVPHLAGRNAKYRHVNNFSEWEFIEETFQSVPYEKKFGLEDPFSEESLTEFGISPDEKEPLKFAFRVLTGAE